VGLARIDEETSDEDGRLHVVVVVASARIGRCEIVAVLGVNNIGR
jgi:hypothetical protein